jgi:hypothetical protein
MRRLAIGCNHPLRFAWMVPRRVSEWLAATLEMWCPARGCGFEPRALRFFKPLPQPLAVKSSQAAANCCDPCLRTFGALRADKCEWNDLYSESLGALRRPSGKTRMTHPAVKPAASLPIVRIRRSLPIWWSWVARMPIVSSEGSRRALRVQCE